MSVSIENFGDRKLCNSPRTLDACAELGVLPTELIARPVSSHRRPAEAGAAGVVQGGGGGQQRGLGDPQDCDCL